MKFVFDLDGTICFKGQPVSEIILKGLEKLVAQGHEVIFASARPIRDLLPVLHERVHTYPMIGGNGSMVSIKGKTISTVSFDKEILDSIFPLLKTYNISYLIDSDWDYSYTGSTSHPILNNLDPQKRAKNVSLNQLNQIIKILILNSNNMHEVENKLKELDVVVHTHGKEGVLDISPKGVDKWTGLQKLGVKKGEYIAFGNDANDIAMFQHALHSVIVGENLQLVPLASEQLPFNSKVEELLVRKFDELGSNATISPFNRNILNFTNSK
ncbi:HAD-IIB family hydrolase [Bacillus manliponensis]|uniref:HAD-IIB family hydrolase n=1 Tax=Bacillus manliponensis TaxID=574376 RepID=UPI00068C98ED|nr:HAD-IIB family hydrolase [Bacillus manliponensis]